MRILICSMCHVPIRQTQQWTIIRVGLQVVEPDPATMSRAKLRWLGAFNKIVSQISADVSTALWTPCVKNRGGRFLGIELGILIMDIEVSDIYCSSMYTTLSSPSSPRWHYTTLRHSFSAAFQYLPPRTYI